MVYDRELIAEGRSQSPSAKPPRHSLDNQNYIRTDRGQYDQPKTQDSDQSNPFKPNYGQSMFIIKH